MRSTRAKTALIAALALTLSTLGGCFMLPTEEELLAPPLVEPVQIEYKTEPVKRGDLENTLQVTAYFKPVSFHQLFFTHSGGRLQTMHARLGQEVKAGDVLIELDSTDIQKKIRDQEIVLEKLRLNIERLEEGSPPDEYSVRSAQIDLENAKNQLSDLESELLTLQVSYYETQNTEAKRIELKAQIAAIEDKIRDQLLAVEKAEVNLARLTQESDDTYALDIAQLDLRAAQNVMNDLREQYDASLLRAPIDGTITYIRDMDVGASISAYTHLISMAGPESLVLQYEDSTRAAQFPVGLEVTITINRVAYTGSVVSNPSTNPLDPNGARQNYARFDVFDIDMAEAGVVSGTSAQVVAVLDSRQNVIVLKKNQVNNYLGRKYVNVLEDGLKVERDVEIGLETSTQVEIVKGLSEGELIITN